MTAVLLVVGDAGAPTAGDLFLQSVLEDDLSYTVTLRSDDTADSVVGFDGVLIAESCSSATLGAKYDTAAVSVVTHEPGNVDMLRLSTSISFGDTSHTQITWLDTAHPIADGPFGTLSGTDTILSAASIISWINNSDIPSGVTLVADLVSGGGTNITCLACETGAVLASGTAPAKRCFMWPKEAASALLTGVGLQAVQNCYYWAFEPTPQVIAWVTA